LLHFPDLVPDDEGCTLFVVGAGSSCASREALYQYASRQKCESHSSPHDLAREKQWTFLRLALAVFRLSELQPVADCSNVKTIGGPDKPCLCLDLHSSERVVKPSRQQVNCFFDTSTDSFKCFRNAVQNRSLVKETSSKPTTDDLGN
jgi:hypothetical protein